MAAATKEPRSKATWSELAKRWEIAAENRQKQRMWRFKCAGIGLRIGGRSNMAG